MIGVDKIGQIRRAYFERRRSIKEIVRTLSVSRATVRKVIRGHKTEFKYERGVQPTPKLGDWVEVLTEILEQEAKLPKRERRSTQRLFEELRGRGYGGAHDSVHRFVKAWRDERVWRTSVDLASAGHFRATGTCANCFGLDGLIECGEMLMASASHRAPSLRRGLLCRSGGHWCVYSLLG